MKRPAPLGQGNLFAPAPAERPTVVPVYAPIRRPGERPIARVRVDLWAHLERCPGCEECRVPREQGCRQCALCPTWFHGPQGYKVDVRGVVVLACEFCARAHGVPWDGHESLEENWWVWPEDRTFRPAAGTFAKVFEEMKREAR